MAPQFYAYYRVSTDRQGKSGLGLDAQRHVTSEFAKQQDGQLIGEFTEVESGKRTRRPQLNAALEACKRAGATLLIAKLDRLARNVHFISGLLEADVKFIAVDMPNADRFMLHVYAAMAEEEGRRISERTKSALARAKARGVRLGKHGETLGAKRKQEADRFAKSVGHKINAKREIQRMTFKDIAEHLNSEKLKSSGGGKWFPASVRRVHRRFIALAR